MKKSGELIGMHLTNVNRLEKGHSAPSIEIFKKLISTFDVSADYLLDDDADSPEVHIGDKSPAEKIRLIDSLDVKDKEALVQVIDSMLTKKRMRELLGVEG